VCGLYDLKPAVVAQALAPNSTIRFSSDFGGETNIYEGFDLTTVARFKRGAFVSAGINSQKRIFDQCNLVAVGIPAAITTATTEVAEIFPDGSKACHQDLPYRPDFKFNGSYTLPYDVVLSAVYQFSRGVQTGGAAPSIQATWSTMPASATTLGRAYSAGATTKSANLMAVGVNYGFVNLNQLDIRASKRIKLDKVRLRLDFDAYNILNSDWPFVVSSAFSNAASSAWLRPSNVLQSRFFKIGANIDF
jgi:hypothetical protein